MSGDARPADPEPAGRLELTWTNKHLRLLAREDGGYEWVPPADHRVSEVRLLHDLGRIGVGQVGRPDERRAADNLLIEGDALHGLTALARLPEFAREYLGAVRLAYFDPPFNTGRAFTHYDDALQHSVWLTMMRDRLTQTAPLLSPAGSVWVHCDDAEQHRLRCVLDEVFGARNFVTTIVWSRSDVPRSSARLFSNDQDYILVYAKDIDRLRVNRLPRDARTDSAYRNPDDDPRGPWRLTTFTATKPYRHGRYPIAGPTGRVFTPPNGTYWRRPQEAFQELDADGRVYWGVRGDAAPMIKTYLSEVGDLVPRTLWHHQDVGSSRTAKYESKALFGDEGAFATPKPEALLARVLAIGSDPGDVVLDCFAGSGTTAAVAHKLGRRWVAVERDPATVGGFAMERLERVVRGDDPGGVSGGVGWVGGGGFRRLRVAGSMFEVDGGVVFLARELAGAALAEATAAQLGVEYRPDPPFSGRTGRSRLAVVDGVVNEAVVRLLVGALGEGERLLVCGTGVDPAAGGVLRSLRPGSTVRPIPVGALAECRSVTVHPEGFRSADAGSAGGASAGGASAGSGSAGGGSAGAGPG